MIERPPIILASASPRRHELLNQLGIKHEIHAVDIDESCLSGESPAAGVERLAVEKAKMASSLFPQALIIGSDTMVVIENKILGKPEDRVAGRQMLEWLSGRQHEVLTAVAIIGMGRELSCVQQSKVSFRQLSAAEIEAYWQTGEPVDKAGGYAVQGIAAQFIQHLEGSFSGVMGLPLFETSQLLMEFGFNSLELSDA